MIFPTIVVHGPSACKLDFLLLHGSEPGQIHLGHLKKDATHRRRGEIPVRRGGNMADGSLPNIYSRLSNSPEKSTKFETSTMKLPASDSWATSPPLRLARLPR